MKKTLVFLLIIVSILFATEYKDSVINYIFENRAVFEKYSQEKEYSVLGFMLGKKDYEYEKENIWQRESLFTTNANIEAYYKNKKEIIWSISGNRKLMKEPEYFNVILPLIKEGDNLDLNFLVKIPNDILVKNKKRVKDLLLFFINRASQRWDKEQYKDIYDFSYKGYTSIAVLAQLDSVYNYKMIPLWDSYVKDVLSNCIEDYDSFQKRRFITATEFLKITDTCSTENKKLKEKAIYYIENTTDSGIVHYVNKSYSKEKIISDFLENPSSIKVEYLRQLGDTSIISTFAPYIISLKKGRATDFAYFSPIHNLLRSFYCDFDLNEKYFEPERSYKSLDMIYSPGKHNNRPLLDLYSENYMDYMKQYKVWLKKKFGKELKREPQPDDIVIMGETHVKHR